MAKTNGLAVKTVKEETRAMAQTGRQLGGDAQAEACTPNGGTPNGGGAVALTPEVVALEVPMLRLVYPDGPKKGEQLNPQRRLDVTLTVDEAAALREVYDGLCARATFGRPNPSPADAVRWLLRRLGEKRRG